MRKPSKSRGKRAELQGWLEQSGCRSLGEPEWIVLQQQLAPVSASYLRRLVREVATDAGVALSPLVEGVRQETFQSLEQSLLGLLQEYEAADALRRKAIRRLVIEAKDHARLAGRKADRREIKQEMTLWMVTWLENPELFPAWVQLRKQRLTPGAAGEGMDVREEV